jgi:hypothetical protein
MRLLALGVVAFAAGGALMLICALQTPARRGESVVAWPAVGGRSSADDFDSGVAGAVADPALSPGVRFPVAGKGAEGGEGREVGEVGEGAEARDPIVILRASAVRDPHLEDWLGRWASGRAATRRDVESLLGGLPDLLASTQTPAVVLAKVAVALGDLGDEASVRAAFVFASGAVAAALPRVENARDERVDPNDVSALDRAASVLARRGQWDEMVRIYRAIVMTGGHSYRLRYALADAHARDHDPEAAIGFLRAIVADVRDGRITDADGPQLAARLWSVAREVHCEPEAIEDIRLLLRREPPTAPAFSRLQALLVTALAQSGNIDAATQQLNRWAALHTATEEDLAPPRAELAKAERARHGSTQPPNRANGGGEGRRH